MRPSVPEQLEGLARILGETVAPEVAAPYPAEILGSVIMSLNALARVWYAVPSYLNWDIAETEALLAEARPHLDPPLATDLVVELAATQDPLDLKALEDRQRRLHELLCRAIPAITTKPELTETKTRMAAFFRERADRFPFAMLARPAPKKEG